MDYENNVITTTLVHNLGRRMIDVGQERDAGDRVYEMIRSLVLTPNNREQPMCVHTEMLEFYEIFRVNDEGTLLILLPTTMLVGVLDTAFWSSRTPPRTPCARTQRT